MNAVSPSFSTSGSGFGTRKYLGGGGRENTTLITQKIHLDATLKYLYKLKFFLLLVYPVKFGNKILCSLDEGNYLKRIAELLFFLPPSNTFRKFIYLYNIFCLTQRDMQ